MKIQIRDQTNEVKLVHEETIPTTIRELDHDKATLEFSVAVGCEVDLTKYQVLAIHLRPNLVVVYTKEKGAA